MLRKYGTGQVIGVESGSDSDSIDKTAAQDWQSADEQALQAESES